MRLKKGDFLSNLDFYLKEIENGKIFIYPTDTIYGIGCSALNSDSIKKIRLTKKREKKPFSIIAPNKEWINENFEVLHHEKLNLFPGKYTFILNSKTNFLPKEINPKENSYGIRIPNNWFCEILEIPFITTSVNFSGENHITKIDEISKEILKYVDYVIDVGILDGSPSTILDLRNEEIKVVRK